MHLKDKRVCFFDKRWCHRLSNASIGAFSTKPTLSPLQSNTYRAVSQPIRPRSTPRNKHIISCLELHFSDLNRLIYRRCTSHRISDYLCLSFTHLSSCFSDVTTPRWDRIVRRCFPSTFPTSRSRATSGSRALKPSKSCGLPPLTGPNFPRYSIGFSYPRIVIYIRYSPRHLVNNCSKQLYVFK